MYSLPILLLPKTPRRAKSDIKPTEPPTVKSSNKLSAIGNSSEYIPSDTASCAIPASDS